MKEKQAGYMVEILPHSEMAVTTLHWLIEATLGSFGTTAFLGAEKPCHRMGIGFRIQLITS